jgi:CRISPR-associated protein Cas1
MLNEFAYCARLGYLEWVQGEFADSADTVEGRFHHRRVDGGRQRARAGEAGAQPARIHERSVLLGSEELGLSAKIDLVQGEGQRVLPVDYKRGRRPHVPRGAYEPELVQLCAQGLLLREHGYECTEGVLYFAGSRERVHVVLDDALVARTIELARQMRAVAGRDEIPPPLVDSPKCPRCSLVGICLPDEVRFLGGGVAASDVRPLLPARDDALPLHVQHQGARIRKDGDVLQVLEEDAVIAEARLGEVSQVVLFGGVHITTPTVHELCQRGIPVTWLSHGGWFYGITHGMSHKNVELRRRQYATAGDPERSLALARRFVRAKIANCRTLLRRNHPEPPEAVLRDLKEDMRRAGEAERLDTLLGVEGTAAHRYFSAFGGMLRPGTGTGLGAFDFLHRNRRPPRDPVNALLSLAYAMLTREWTVVGLSVGLDPYLGFYHQPRYGRPALALDLIEEFRPLVGDSLVLTVVNNGEITAEHFVEALGAVSLTAAGRARFIEAYERRLSQEITHPVFGYRISYRRVFEVQARLLARHLTGEIPEYPSFTTR